jgi:hypothetical protein
MQDVDALLDEHRIYFPEQICELLQKLSNTMSQHVNAAGIYAPLDPYQSVPENQTALLR